ncbi:hypothetical protein NDU88_002030 [Pleurodeles waltl]|uniref:Uncharacterized protein n=1 Tax=Pleurodeles waltl TaxID=8319 RepID=A0AAV7KUE4_PLEWA|nr:hypothetical protein NDU88_002030 [Pleurodeles waltl]
MHLKVTWDRVMKLLQCDTQCPCIVPAPERGLGPTAIHRPVPGAVLRTGQAVPHLQPQPRGTSVGLLALRDPIRKSWRKSDAGESPRVIRTRGRRESGGGARPARPRGVVSRAAAWGLRGSPSVWSWAGRSRPRVEGRRLRGAEPCPDGAGGPEELHRTLLAVGCWLLTGWRPDPEERRAAGPGVRPRSWTGPLDAGPDRGQTGSAGRNSARPCVAAPAPRATYEGGSRVLPSSGPKTGGR